MSDLNAKAVPTHVYEKKEFSNRNVKHSESHTQNFPNKEIEKPAHEYNLNTKNSRSAINKPTPTSFEPIMKYNIFNCTECPYCNKNYYVANN